MSERLRIVNYVEKGGSRFHKCAQVNEALSSQFALWKQKRRIVHDWDLQTAAILTARKIGFSGFKASPCWVKNWKRRNRVVGRKIRRYPSPDDEAAKEKGRSFVEWTNLILGLAPEKKVR